MLVMDGYGDDASSSAYVGRGNRLERHWSTGIFNSLGLVYTFVTEHLGFAGFGDEGKVMALAAFGEDTYVERFRDVIRPTPDGGYAVDMSYFDYDAFGQLRPMRRKFIETFGDGPRAPRADHRPASRPRVRPAGRHRGDHPPHRARPARQVPAARPVHDRRRGAQLRRQRQDPGAHRRAPHLGAAVRLRHGRAARQRAVALPPDARAAAQLRADAPLLRPGLQRRPDRSARCRPPGCATSGCEEGAAAAPGGAGPGRRQDRRLVPGPLRDGPARARQPLDPGRPAPRRDARHAQRQGQEARGLPPVRAGGAGRAVGRVLRDRPARPVHDAGAARARRQARRSSRRRCTSTARGASRRSSAPPTRATTA